MNEFLMLVLLAAETTVPVGSLCFETQHECVATKAATIEVEPHDAARRFVWTAADGRTVVAGELASEATTVDLGLPASRSSTDGGRRSVRFSVDGNTGRGWPHDVRFTLIESKEKRWAWTLPAKQTKGEVTIHTVATAQRLTIAAARHLTAVRQIPPAQNLDLRQITLKPLPAIAGRVTRVDGEEIAAVMGAQIVLPEGKVGTTTNEQGTFRMELSEPLPQEVVVVVPGLASHVVAFQRLDAENDLGEIRLAEGAALRVEIERPDAVRAKSVKMQLLKRAERRYEPSVVTTATLQPEQESILFSDLAAGEYVIVFEGQGELERLAVPVEIGKEDVTLPVAIRPYRLEGELILGSEAMTRGHVAVHPRMWIPTWRATLPVDERGTFGGLMWQPGKLSGFVAETGLGGLLIAESPELGSDPSIWKISFRKRLIEGRVFDAQTREGAGKVKLRLETASPEGLRGYTSVSVAPEGTYEILAWQDGTYDLRLTADEYLPLNRSVVLTERDDSRKVDFPLERGTKMTLEAVWGSGQPVAGSQVLEGIAPDGHNPERIHVTDSAGRLALRVAPNEPRLLYVLPREGSFLPVRITAGSVTGEQPLRVEVPPPVGTIRVSTRDREGNHVPGIIVMRFNGEWLPYPVTGRLRTNRVAGGIELLGMPAGAYEIWAVAPGRRGEATAPHRPPAHAPARVGLAGGEVSVEVTVEGL
ncbi:MAG TPA: carboxypeptidase-like regulatory domain-containing protein [Thermoanaerobaculia bacterium]|nr:carboxypeptidase-like regulatory domain-containing protein [Thermoanaerobaculia bacterium]